MENIAWKVKIDGNFWGTELWVLASLAGQYCQLKKQEVTVRSFTFPGGEGGTVR